MSRARQLIALARTCFRPSSPLTLLGVSAYGFYLAWLAIWEVHKIGDTTYVHLGLTLATAGAWIGARVGETARWPGSRFSPPFVLGLCTIAAFASAAALALNGVAAAIGGLHDYRFVPFGILAMAAGLAGGCARPALPRYLSLCLVALVPLGPLLFRASVPSPEPDFVWSVAALVGTIGVLVGFAAVLRTSDVASLSLPAMSRFSRTLVHKLLPSRLLEPAIHRVAVVSGLLAAGCTYAHTLPALDWRDGPLMVLIGTVCANLGASGTSASLPRGPLPGASWLLQSGIARTRSNAGRRMLWRIVADSMVAAGIFAAVAVALGPDWHVFEMMLVALAACHVYLAGACSWRWLLTNRLSVFVATPFVAALAWAAWTFLPWALPTALVACVVSAFVAVYVGGFGIGRIDLDPMEAI